MQRTAAVISRPPFFQLSSAMPYKVKLASFEGPLDLLLFLIRKAEVDIYNIPIAKITQQYLEYLEIIQLLDLESASDFILMAATLMRIKSQMLLPKQALEDEEEELEDPRQELVYRLLEYKRFKDVAVDLSKKEDESRKSYNRGSFEMEQEAGGDVELDVTLFDLIAAFKEVYHRNLEKPVHRVYETPVTLEQRLAFIRDKLSADGEIKFSQLFGEQDGKIVWIVTFIALLELIKKRAVSAMQHGPFQEIVIRANHG